MFSSVLAWLCCPTDSRGNKWTLVIILLYRLVALPDFPTETRVVNAIIIVAGILTSVGSGWFVGYLERRIHL
jgi:hypothetical protein